MASPYLTHGYTHPSIPQYMPLTERSSPLQPPCPLNLKGIAHFESPNTIAKQYIPLVRVRILFLSYRKTLSHFIAIMSSYKIKRAAISEI